MHNLEYNRNQFNVHRTANLALNNQMLHGEDN